MTGQEVTVALHYATAVDWQTSLAAGEHVISGRGMTLAGEGFIHLCLPEQRAGVWQRFWADCSEPVVMLSVDPRRLAKALVLENTSGGSELFPHLYGPLPIAAVTSARPVDADGLPWPDPADGVAVTHDAEAGSFVITVDGTAAGVCDYQLTGDHSRLAVFPHTEVDHAYRGRGLADQLVAIALNEATLRGWQVEPTCWFVDKFLRTNQQYAFLRSPAPG